MPQEFQVLQCYKCETFQVHQVKKTTKWQCKLCGEKQSLKKVFGRGTGSECRCHVQKLNTIRGELSTTITTSSLQFVTSQQFDSSRSHTTHHLDDDEEGTCHNVIQTQQSGNNKWNLFVDKDSDDSNGGYDDDGNYEDNMFTTDASLFKRGKKRKRMNKKSYDEYNDMQRPDQRKTDNWGDHGHKLSGQVNKYDYHEPSHNSRQSSRFGASDKYSTENQFYENKSFDVRQADTYNFNDAPNVNSSYKSSFNTSNSTNSASKWNNFVPVENSPETQEDENELADTRQTEEIFKRASNVTNNFKNLGHEASKNSRSKWNNYTPTECSNGDDLYDHDSADTRQKELNSFKAKSKKFDKLKLSSKASTNVSSKWNNFVSAANKDPDSDTDEDNLHDCYHGYHDKNELFSNKKSNFENVENSEKMNKTVLTERQTMGNEGQLNTGLKNSSDERHSPVTLNVFERKAVESSVKTAAPKHSKWGSYVNTSTCENVYESAYYISGSSNKASGLTFTAGDLTDEDFNL